MFRGFFWGAIVGAIVGLLFAPRPGDETRAQLQSRISDLQAQTQTQFDALKTRSSTLIEQGRQTVNSTLNRTQTATDSAAADVQNHLNANA